LDRARVWAQARQFQVEFLVLTARLSAHRGLDQLTAIADLLLDRLLGPVEAWLGETHGRVPGGRFAVIAMGKLGSRELTIGSDLDLVFVFDAGVDAKSDGPKPITAGTYYARLSQRVISALSAPTAEGRLFEIDMRLRPSGNAGPVACSLESFDGYQRRTAQVWEHQALTRARAVAGDAGLRRELEAIIDDVLTVERETAPLAGDVAAMRARIFREHGKRDPFELKHHPGGVVTLEFLAQYLVLAHAAMQPSLLHRTTEEVFVEAGRLGLLDAAEAATLVRALRLNHALAAVVRLTVDARFDPAEAPETLQAALLAAAQAALEDDQACIDMATLTRELEAGEVAVAELFARRVGPFLPEEAGGSASS
jgi:glutamate-ammonia-ligase adenylyltransferase